MNWKSNASQPVHARETDDWFSFHLPIHSSFIVLGLPWPPWVSDEAPGAGNGAWLVECSSSIHKALGSSPSRALTKCGVCILGYGIGSRPAWATQDHVSKKKKIVSQRHIASISKVHSHSVG